MELISIGYGNFIVKSRLLCVLNPDSLPMKRFREESRERGTLVDATKGRKTRSILLIDSGHVVLSGIQTDTIAHRLEIGCNEEHE